MHHCWQYARADHEFVSVGLVYFVDWIVGYFYARYFLPPSWTQVASMGACPFLLL